MTAPARTAAVVLTTVLALGLLAGCAVSPTVEPEAGADGAPGTGRTASPSPTGATATGPATPTASPTQPDATAARTRTGPQASDGRPRRASLTIPRIGIRDLAVVPYRGVTDDAAGTRIQDGGVAASPHGPRGGVGPGGVGNYQVTAHRLSSTQAFLDLPALRRGDLVHVEADGRRWTYEVRDTRITSFRSPRSLREQRADVPGRPGAVPTQAVITLSTCRTPEDRAEGNTWSDRFGNPENRIDKIGVLVRSRRVG